MQLLLLQSGFHTERELLQTLQELRTISSETVLSLPVSVLVQVQTVSFCVVYSGTTISSTNQGRNNNNNTILNNIMFRARYGVSICGGGATNLNQNNRIDSNIIGSNAYDGGAIGKTGILVQFQNNCSIQYNTVKYIGGPSTNTTAGADRVGIGVGSRVGL
ncbi:MAG: hypothetical protein IPL67_10805 [Ignavibacteria bacterium]|nr:hypothetical protein [Ignavibacteria bacterium]